jgi:argininosuccinate lyase
MPLGAAALAGTTYPIDREQVAGCWIFPGSRTNSMDAVSDRDFAMEFLAAASICMVHLSRLSEEFVLWSTSEFGFITLSDAFCHRQQHHAPEKEPGHPGDRARQNRSGVRIPDGPVDPHEEPAHGIQPGYAGGQGAAFRWRGHAQGLPGHQCSDDSADYRQPGDHAPCRFRRIPQRHGHGRLPGCQGVPFRKAHSCVGKAVAYALDKGKELDQLSLDELKSFSPQIKADIFDRLTLEVMIDRRTSLGGTATENVARSIEDAKKVLAGETQA